jgi:uncharacterized repeat protein (TIGR01451 family)
MVGVLPILIKSHTISGPAHDSAQPGDLIMYTLTYSNPDVIALTGVVITDVLPPQLSFVSGTPAPEMLGNGVLRWHIPDMPPGTGGSIAFTARVTNAAADRSTVQNVAQLQTAEHTISALDPLDIRYRYDLQLSQAVSKLRAPPGTILQYTFQLTNVTSVNVTLTNIVATVYLAPGLPDLTQTHVLDCVAPCAGWNFAGSDGDGDLVYTRTIAALNPNATTQFSMSARISPTLPADVLAVAAYSRVMDDGQHGTEVDPTNQLGESITTVKGPDIWIQRVLAPMRGIPKQNLNVKVVLTNNGFVSTSGPDGKGWFGIDLYVKPYGSPPPSGPADRYLGACPTAINPCTNAVRFDTQYKAFGYVPSSTLTVDQVITMTFPLTIAPTYPLTASQPVRYWLYAQADTYWNDPDPIYGVPNHGRIVEGNEVNNIFGPFEIMIDYGKVYLPLIRR